MSTGVSTGVSTTAGLPTRGPWVPEPRRRGVLTVVPTRATSAPRAPFVAAVVALLVAGLFGLLALNTVLGKDAFRLYALQVEGRVLADQEQALTREVEALRAPSSLAERAVGLGMVPAGPPAFLRLPDGAVLGAAQPVQETAQSPTQAPAQSPTQEPAQAAQEPAPADHATTDGDG